MVYNFVIVEECRPLRDFNGFCAIDCISMALNALSFFIVVANRVCMLAVLLRVT